MNIPEFKTSDKETISLLNTIFNKNQPIDLYFNNKKYAFCFEQFANFFTPSFIIKFNLNNEPILLYIENNIINNILEGFITDIPVADLDANLKNIIIQALSEDLINQLEKKIKKDIVINNLSVSLIKDNKFNKPDMFFKIVSEDNIKINGGFLLNKTGIKNIANMYKKREISYKTDYNFLEFNISVLIDRIKISHKELSNLGINDIIILNNADFLTNSDIYIKTPLRIYSGDKKDNLITLNNIVEESMSSDNNTGDDINNIPITLEFEIGRKTLTLGELKTIQTGYAFELDAKIERPVSIIANGKNIATGEIIKIEDKIGVRILEFSGNAR
jgi:flagellar motor switch protein FliN